MDYSKANNYGLRENMRLNLRTGCVCGSGNRVFKYVKGNLAATNIFVVECEKCKKIIEVSVDDIDKIKFPKGVVLERNSKTKRFRKIVKGQKFDALDIRVAGSFEGGKRR